VPAITAQVHGYAIDAGLFTRHRGCQNAGLRRAPRLSHSGDVIDVDVESSSHVGNYKD
jgi:hypothetical protein